MNNDFPCAHCGGSVSTAKLADGPEMQFCCKSHFRRFMAGRPDTRRSVLKYRYSGLRASNSVLRGSPEHHPRADWLAVGGWIVPSESPPDDHGILVVAEKSRSTGEERFLIMREQ